MIKLEEARYCTGLEEVTGFLLKASERAILTPMCRVQLEAHPGLYFCASAGPWQCLSKLAREAFQIPWRALSQKLPGEISLSSTEATMYCQVCLPDVPSSQAISFSLGVCSTSDGMIHL